MRSTILLIALLLIVFFVVAIVEQSPDMVPTELPTPPDTLKPLNE